MVLADARAPALLACAPLSLVLADVRAPHSLHGLLCHWCGQMVLLRAPPSAVVPAAAPRAPQSSSSHFSIFPSVLVPSAASLAPATILKRATRPWEKAPANHRRREEADAAGAGDAKEKQNSVCQHHHQRDKCKECGGAGICQHHRQRSR